MLSLDAMVVFLLVKGIIAGFAVASPSLGPIALLCVQRSINHGTLAGVFTGFGAAVADAFFALLAAYGLSVIVHILSDYGIYVRLVGASFLFYVGVRTMRRPVVIPAIHVLGRHSYMALFKDFASSLFLTLINPFTIIAFLALFATLNIAELNFFYVPYVLCVSVFIGSMLWWLVLTYFSGRFRKHLTGNALRWVNKVSGFFIVILSFVTVGSIFIR